MSACPPRRILAVKLADLSWPRAARETLAVIEEAFEAERRHA